ncbi:hypothetical protein E2C01_049954 [Portunus trituberculatus]|uniref:Uncharacterized protein n=1 Tax=Portunus trituberculatus TaxID=210409 RepID=A0A5B7GF61_PORTR|nr:hypothetical protein [Portunus trituberculatus]
MSSKQSEAVDENEGLDMNEEKKKEEEEERMERSLAFPMGFPSISQRFQAFTSVSKRSPVFLSVPLRSRAFSCVSPTFPTVPLHSPVFSSIPLRSPAFPCVSHCFPALFCVPLRFCTFPSVPQRSFLPSRTDGPFQPQTRASLDLWSPPGSMCYLRCRYLFKT